MTETTQEIYQETLKLLCKVKRFESTPDILGADSKLVEDAINKLVIMSFAKRTKMLDGRVFIDITKRGKEWYNMFYGGLTLKEKILGFFCHNVIRMR